MSQQFQGTRESRTSLRFARGRLVGGLAIVALCMSAIPAFATGDSAPSEADLLPSPPVERGESQGAGGEFCACDCDVNEDGLCTVDDLFKLLAVFGGPPGPGCLETVCDGIIDERDIATWTCLFEGGGVERCCDGLEPKWRQRPHPSGEGYNVASDVDWQTLAEQEPGDPGPGPNWVIADDFRSDGRPITAIRWWGSYIDPRFEPGDPPSCDCDIDGDGVCTFDDLLLLLACVGQPPSEDCPADLDCNGIIDERDADVWQCLFEGNPPDVCCPPCAEPVDEIDGWLLSFHTDLPAEQNPEGFSKPLDLLGLYFAPADAIEIERTPLVGWDEHRVYEYRVRLDRTHLIHRGLDTRAGATPPVPATEKKFLETENFIYWLDVQAVVGHTYEKQNLCPTCDCDLDGDQDCDFDDLLIILGCFGGNCGDITCDGVTDEEDVCVFTCLFEGGPEAECCGTWVEVPTLNRADDHFWGWHTSPDLWNDVSTMGQVVHGPNGEWVYRGWQPVDGSEHGIEFVNNAFDLLTPFCPGDLSGNGAVDFADIIEVIINWGDCLCVCPTDIDCDGRTGFSDLLVVLSTWGPCL